MSGPSQLGKAMYWVAFAYVTNWYQCRGATFDQVARVQKPYLDYESMWPFAYQLTEEEAAHFKVMPRAEVVR